MDFRDDAALADFRGEVRRFIGEHLPADWVTQDDDGAYGARAVDAARTFQRAMAERRWLTMAWPREYGGLGASHWRQLVMNEELAYHRAPGGNMGVMWVGPSLLLYGTEAQKAQHVRAIADAEVWWCTLYSEPGAGSDLAAMQTRAVADGDDYLINGQKIWTSGAQSADWGWLAARTDPDAPKHTGLTMFMVDMRSPGVTVRPLVNMAGGHSFNQVFFEDVRVSKANVVGEVNRGWYHMAVALDFERSGIGSFARGRRIVEEYAGYARDHPETIRRRPSLRYDLADRAVEVQVGTHLAYRITDLQTRGIVANYEASVSKLFASELAQRIQDTGMAMLGTPAVLIDPGDPRAALRGSPGRGYLHAVSATIAAGTSEIQRGIIATRGLGLPRG
ncbi:MAG: acyl-CoA dehydrogenase family protein [Chloroflexota bacterium]|nr:acyl-CoA dehydrogenase family protein [Chloroflexota bacterium]